MTSMQQSSGDTWTWDLSITSLTLSPIHYIEPRVRRIDEQLKTLLLHCNIIIVQTDPNKVKSSSAELHGVVL